MLRSEKMGLYQLIIPRESSWEVLNKLGYNNSLHFIDDDSNIP